MNNFLLRKNYILANYSTHINKKYEYMFCKDNYRYSFGTHKAIEVIWIAFPNDELLKTALRSQLPTARWSASQKSWYIPDRVQARDVLGLPPKLYSGKNLMEHLAAINAFELQRLIDELRLKAYSESTIKTYSTEFAQFLYILKNKDVKEVTVEQLRSYLLYCFKKLKVTESQMNSRLNAIKFYFVNLLKREQFYIEIPRPKQKKALPTVLSQRDIQRLFLSTTNTKHLLILKLAYGLGLRVSEVVNIKITDIDSDKMLVHIRNAKGKKDRYVPLPTTILNELRQYYLQFRPKGYLFEGQDGGSYSIRSAQHVFKTAMKKAKINKVIGIHGLRHSYATHLLEYGTDMSFIQKLLGHRNIKTTEIYAKVTNVFLSNVKSPLDYLDD